MTKRFGFALTLALSLFAGACGRSMMYNSRLEEFRNPNIPLAHYDTIAVLPLDPRGFDAQVSGRARAKLKTTYKIPVVPALKAVGEGEVGMTEVCPPSSHVAYKGVLFVSWDRLILRDCETKAVAYRVLGNYAGIDRMLAKLLDYLQAKPAQ